MSETCCIARQNANGTIDLIHLHSGCSPKYAGRQLMAWYNDPAKVNALIALGPLSSLGMEIGEKHSFHECQACINSDHNWCRAYARDRGDKKFVGPRHYEDIVKARTENDVTHFYMFTTAGLWYYVAAGGGSQFLMERGGIR